VIAAAGPERNALPAAGPERTALLMGRAGALTALLWAALLHHGVGPSFRKDVWFEPNSFLIGYFPHELAGALAVLVLPCAALALAVCFVASSVVARVVAGFATLASACFVAYGLEAAGVWRFFHWRWSVAALLFSAVVALAAYAPVLAERWRRFGWPLRAATYLPIFAFLVVYERNVTGTNPELPFAISPWPVVQVVGLELVASAIAALELGVALGLAGLARGPWLAGLGVLAAAGFPLASLALGSASGLLPFQAGPRLYTVTAIACFAVLAVCALWRPRGSEAFRRRAANIGLGGLLAALPLVAGQALTRLDYSVTRDGHAQQIIDALAAQRTRTGAYPDELSELVGAGLLPEVPKPRIGFASSQEFVYQNFGESYLLEFSAPRWIQCAYNPPFVVEPGEEPEPGDGEDLGGAWSCPQKPPELW
jgi:hypothetical protein